MDVTPRELRDCDIAESFRGYNRDEVNDLLDRAAATIEALDTRVRQLMAQFAEGGPSAAAAPGAGGEAPVVDQAAAQEGAARTLALAQRVADEAVAEAKAQASELLTSAESRSRQLIAEAEAEVRRVHEVERARLESELGELVGRRDQIGADVSALEVFERDYSARLLRAVQADLALLESRSPVMDTPRPSGSGSVASVAPRDAAPSRGADATQLLDADTADPDHPGAPDADLASRLPLVGSALEAATDSSVSNGGGDTAGPTIDLAEEQAADAAAPRSDEDDRFFASLRDAVSDDAAMSAGEERMFDPDDERDPSFRDVFRRRR